MHLSSTPVRLVPVVLLASAFSSYAFIQCGVTGIHFRRDAIGQLHATETEASGETVLGSKYVLHDEGEQSTSGKSTLVEALPWQEQAPSASPGGDLPKTSVVDEGAAVERERVIVKFSENIKALKREVQNYEKVTNSDTKDLFVKVHDFYNPSEDEENMEQASNSHAAALGDTPQFKGQAALVMERGAQDLQTYLKEKGPLQGSALQDAVVKTARTVQACHDQTMVWTELKATNFVIQPDANGEFTDIKAIDLESAVPQGGNPIDFSWEAIPPEFAVAYLCGREPFMEMEPSFDIFSLGLLWYEMATGSSYWQQYFDQSEPCEIQITNALRTTRDQMPVPANSDKTNNMKIESELKELIVRCLKIDPMKRPAIGELMSHPYIAQMAM